MLGHRDANVTRAVYVRELSDARRRTMRRSRMVAEFSDILGAPDEVRPDRRPAVGRPSMLAGSTGAVATEIGELLPQADDAYGVHEKLRRYSLNFDHTVGGPKARALRGSSASPNRISITWRPFSWTACNASRFPRSAMLVVTATTARS
jgi:hypothetical protein